VRGLGLRRLHHVVERLDTPQNRGMAAAVPHLVEVVAGPTKPSPWAAIPEYTVHPRVEAPKEKAPARKVKPVEVAAAAESVEAAAEAKPKRAKAAKPAKAESAKGKAEKVKEPTEKDAKSAEKPAKTKTSKGKN
jgi:hypothetical protein